MQASVRRALRPDHTVWQAYVDRHFAADVPPDTARWTTATVHSADRHARTGGPGAQAAGADLTLMFRE